MPAVRLKQHGAQKKKWWLPQKGQRRLQQVLTSETWGTVLGLTLTICVILDKFQVPVTHDNIVRRQILFHPRAILIRVLAHPDSQIKTIARIILFFSARVTHWIFQIEDSLLLRQSMLIKFLDNQDWGPKECVKEIESLLSSHQLEWWWAGRGTSVGIVIAFHSHTVDGTLKWVIQKFIVLCRHWVLNLLK